MGFEPPSMWDGRHSDILAFCTALGNQHWTPSKEAREFLLGVQRGYHRVGLAGVADAWRAMAAACLWRACCFPDHLQLVMAGPRKTGHAWVKFLRQVASESVDSIRENLLFTQDDSSILLHHSDDPALVVLDPGLLVGTCKIHGGRPTVLVMPDLDRVPTEWLPSLRSFVDGQEDQWLVVAPLRK